MNEKDGEVLLLPSRAASFIFMGDYYLCPECNNFVSTDSPCCGHDISAAEYEQVWREYEAELHGVVA